MSQVIVLLSTSRYSDREFGVFGGYYYQKLGFEVILISLYEVFYPDKKHIDTSGESYAGYPEYVRNVSSLGELAKLFDSIDCDIGLIVGYLDFASPNINILRLLASARSRELPLVFYHGGAIPITLIDDQKNIFERIARKTAFFTYFGFWGLLVACRLISIPKVVLGARANEIFLDGRYIPYKKYFSHAFDYELALGIDDDRSPMGYVVFLDEFVPFHCDNELLFGFDLSHYADDYYSSLNRYFAVLEASGYQVVIAAHPRSRYNEPEYAWCFGDRMVIKYQTAKLVKNCAFCIGHQSTSFNYAVIFKKPILQLLTKIYIEIADYNESFCLVTQSLNAKVVEIDSLNLKFEIPMIDSQKYEEYMEMYIKTKDSPNKSIYEIFLEVAKNES